MRTSYSKKHKAAISVLSGLTAALLLLTGCSKSEETVYQIPEDRKLIVYTAHKADVYEPIIKEFEERTGIFVELKAGDTLALFDELQQDAPGTFDVMFGGGVENFEECRDYLEPYKVSEIDQIAEQYRTEGDAYTPFSVLPTVFIYNNKLVYPVAAPRTWEELQTDRWKGKIAFADPTKSGSSYTALCTMLQVSDQDEQKTLEDFTGALDGYLSPSSVAVLEEVNAGTRLVGITTEGMARQKILEGADITVIYPADGTSAIPDATAIVKGAKHMENAKLFLEFTVSSDVQRLVEEVFFRRTVRQSGGQGRSTGAVCLACRAGNRIAEPEPDSAVPAGAGCGRPDRGLQVSLRGGAGRLLPDGRAAGRGGHPVGQPDAASAGLAQLPAAICGGCLFHPV